MTTKELAICQACGTVFDPSHRVVTPENQCYCHSCHAWNEVKLIEVKLA